jgi:hypothetical protein
MTTEILECINLKKNHLINVYVQSKIYIKKVYKEKKENASKAVIKANIEMWD